MYSDIVYRAPDYIFYIGWRGHFYPIASLSSSSIFSCSLSLSPFAPFSHGIIASIGAPPHLHRDRLSRDKRTSTPAFSAKDLRFHRRTSVFSLVPAFFSTLYLRFCLESVATFSLHLVHPLEFSCSLLSRCFSFPIGSLALAVFSAALGRIARLLHAKASYQAFTPPSSLSTSGGHLPRPERSLLRQ